MEYAFYLCRHPMQPMPGGKSVAPFFAIHIADRDPTNNLPLCETPDLEPVAPREALHGFELMCLRCAELCEVTKL